MSSVIPKEKQSAYERWELASFGEDSSRDSKNAAAAAAVQSQVDAQVRQQLALLREQAQQEGFRAGFAEGHAAGTEAARAETTREAAALRQLAQSFSGEIGTATETMAESMLELALDLTRAMLKTALTVRPELVLPIVGEAIRYLPSVQQPALLYLHPADAELVRQHMNDELAKSGWRVAEDPHISRGGCRVETASNQIDATMETRWHRIAEALGKESGWIA